MSQGKKWLFLWVLIPILLLGFMGYLFFSHLFDPTFYGEIVERSLTELLGRQVVIGKAKITLREGVGFSFDEFRIQDRLSGRDLFYSKRLILTVRVLPLLSGEVKWKRIVLDEPVLRVLRDNKGRFNVWGDVLTGAEMKASHQQMIRIVSTLSAGAMILRDGDLTLHDESLGPIPVVTRIQSLHFSLSGVSQGPYSFRLSGTVLHSNHLGEVVLSGTVRPVSEDMDLSRASVEAKMELKGIETLHFWPYLRSLLPMEMLSGVLDAKIRYQGSIQTGFQTSVQVKLRDLVLNYPEVFAQVIKPKWMSLDAQVAYNGRDVKVSSVSVRLPELWVKARGKIYGIGSTQMGIDAEAQSGRFDLAEGKKFIPFGLIIPDVSEPLFRSEGKGPVELLSVKLSGELAEIEQCDRPPHARVLSVEARVDGVRLKLPWDLPPLENLRGRLVYRDGHLHFREMEGTVLHTRIDRSDGVFYQLLQVPTLEARLRGRFDLRDLGSLAKTEGLECGLSDLLSHIQIDSGWADYHLFTQGVLKPPFYFQHEGSYRLFKARLNHRRLPFPIMIEEGVVELSNRGLRWSAAKGELGNSSFISNGSWMRGEIRPLKLTMQGKADVKNLLELAKGSLLPDEVGTRMESIEGLSGDATFSFQGEMDANLRFAAYDVEVAPDDVHLRLRGAPYSLVLKEGTFSFSPSGVTLSKVRVSSAHSSLTLNGTAKDGAIDITTRGLIDWKELFPLLQSPLFPVPFRSSLEAVEEVSGRTEGYAKWAGKLEERMALLKEGQIHLKELSVKEKRRAWAVSSVEGSILISPGEIRVIGLRGRVGNSPIRLSGSISRLPGEERAGGVKKRSLLFEVDSPYLDLDLLLPRREVEGPISLTRIKDWLLAWSIDGKIEVRQGRWRGLELQDLRIGMKTVGDRLVIEPVQWKAIGGDVWGGGWVEPAQKGARFEFKPRISNMEIKSFLRALLQKEEGDRIEITGRVHIDRVELRGEGTNLEDMKPSLNGSLRLEVDDGVIERWRILSRIFSILNVSQLFQGRLPDLKTKGLPYRRIMANIRLRNGVAYTDDLVVESDAMRITLLGKIDLVKREIDATIGVHPLVTVDLILSRLPVAGYILTGKDRAFLSYVYEVKGNLDEPKIEAVPIKGLGENLLGMIKRLLETPIRPFQRGEDSGKRE